MSLKSFFAGIEAAEHTFVSWAEKELGALHNAQPEIEAVVAAFLKYAGPALQTVVTVEAGGPAGAEVGKILADAQAALTAASGFVYDYGAVPSLASILGSVVNNLSGLLSASKISNPRSVSTVTTVISNLNVLVTAIEALFPVAPAVLKAA